MKHKKNMTPMEKSLIVVRAIPCAFFLLLLVFCGCCRHAYDTLGSTRDSLRHISMRADSMAHVTGLHDRLLVHDSIYIVQRGDTVIRYVEHTRTRHIWHTDTVRILRYLSDTVFVEHRDTVRTEYHHGTPTHRNWQAYLVVWLVMAMLGYLAIKRRG